MGTIIFALYYASLAHIIFVREALFIQAWILPSTEIYTLIILLSIPSYLVVRNNIVILGRYSELIFFMTFWTIIIYLMPLKYAEWLFVLPVIKEGWLPIISAVKTTFFSYSGFDIAFFLYPYLQKKHQASMGIIAANTLSMILFLIVTIGAFLFFSPDEITSYSEPTIVMLKVIELQFIERLEIVFFSFYIFVISTTVLPLMFMTVFCTSRLMGKRDHRSHLIWLLIIECLIVVIFTPNLKQNTYLHQYIQIVELIIALVLPICLWGYFALRGIQARRGLS